MHENKIRDSINSNFFLSFNFTIIESCTIEKKNPQMILLSKTNYETNLY